MKGMVWFIVLAAVAGIVYGLWRMRVKWEERNRASEDRFASFMQQAVTLNGFRLGEAVVDLAFFGALVWLALRRDRWWTLAAAAFGGLTLIAHALMFLTPDLGQAHIRMDVASRWGIGVLMILCLGGGVVERWMAGERPVSTEARWRRPQRSPT